MDLKLLDFSILVVAFDLGVLQTRTANGNILGNVLQFEQIHFLSESITLDGKTQKRF